MRVQCGARRVLATHRFSQFARCLCLVMSAAIVAGCGSSSSSRQAQSLQLTPSKPSYERPQLGPRRSLAKPEVDPKTGVTASPRASTRRIPIGGGYAKVGKPYRIGQRWYYPKVDTAYNKTGTASWYGKAFHGRKTANGEYFDMNSLSAAHPTLPLPSYVMVTNLANNRSVVVRVNDRGPYAHNRLIDLSRETARRLDFEHKGTARVRVRWVGKAPLDGNMQFEQSFLRRQPWYRRSVASR